MRVSNALALAATGVAAFYAARAALRRTRHFDWQGKTALVTGGSRGLGLVLARKLADQGVNVVIVARTQADLDAAEAELRQRGEVMSIVCDVQDPEEVELAVAQAQQRFGSIDLLFNVAGVIHVGPLDAMTLDDFHDAMATNCWGTLHAALAVLPGMRSRGWGRIVNIASVGGLRAVPHMLPYAASKFAQVGLSKGLRAELAADGILVSTVCPSLMRTGSPRNAIFKGQHRKEYAWFSIGDSLPVLSMNAETAADQILAACQGGVGEVVLRENANVGVLLQSLFPTLTQEALSAAARLLPEMGGIGRHSARGYDSQSEWSPSWLTQLNEQAAVRNNQMRQHAIR
ncbi:putative ketoacyl reductase [Posidoniimonas corsicana]|uniref:Putative ketoacyl reductase n=1 Tax=Posidoniimonas corsicana TaxID=1938618 RepID=A0A5C5VFK8_9BACT|nr:SDR family oxidoreductase [Posidoniimonas corsicana]TWT36891.1 putative ketoacyl reductase [Posidoniimonas corsicana]